MEYLNHVVVLGGLAVLIVQEIIKLKFVPVQFANKYPVPTNIILSVLTAVVVVWKDNLANPRSWTNWVQLVASISLVAAFAYNMTIKHWQDLRAMEG